jgi:hypothetical protein
VCHLTPAEPFFCRVPWWSLSRPGLLLSQQGLLDTTATHEGSQHPVPGLAEKNPGHMDSCAVAQCSGMSVRWAESDFVHQTVAVSTRKVWGGGLPNLHKDCDL